MKFRNFLESALGSGHKVRILKYLLSEGMLASEREIGRLLGISHMSVNRIMKEFQELNLVSQARIGGVNVWKLNKDSWGYSALSALKDIQIDPLQHLKTELSFGAFESVVEAYIFGSVAEGRELPESDIDLLLIVRDEKAKKELKSYLAEKQENCIKKFGNKLSPYLLTLSEAKKEKNKKLIERARARGIKLK